MDDVFTFAGREIRSSDDTALGNVEEVYLDADTDRPEFLLIASGLFGRRRRFVPVEGAKLEGDAVVVPYDEQTVKSSPGVDADGTLSREEEDALFSHYGRAYPALANERAEADQAAGTRDEPDQATGMFANPSHAADDAMTRSEEELRVVGREQRPRERARLKKYQVTEYVTMRVPVTREEVRVEREPLEGSEAPAAPEQSVDELGGETTTLMSEEPIVEKRVVPKERVRLAKETVKDERTVDETVRKEDVRLEGDEHVIAEDAEEGTDEHAG